MAPERAFSRPSDLGETMEEVAKALSDIPAINRFLSYCRIRTVPSKTVIIHAGDLPDILYYIISGSVEVMIEDEDGNEMVLAYLNKGQFFGEMGLFYEQPTRSAWVRTRQQSELAEMTYPRFRQIAAESPGLIFELATQLATRLDRTNRKLGDLAFVDVTGRVAHAIMDLCGEPDAMTHPEGMQIKVSRQELSRLVGCSREMAGRVLKVLEEQGLLRATGKTIVVFNARPKMKTRPVIVPAKPAAGAAARTSSPVDVDDDDDDDDEDDDEEASAGLAPPRCGPRGRHADLPAHLADRLRIVTAAEDRRSRHEGVSPGLRRGADVVHLEPATHLEPHFAAAGLQSRARVGQLAQARGDELLPAEARVHRHDENHVDELERVVEPVERRGGIEHQARPAAVLTNQRDGAVDVLGGFGVERDVGGTGRGEIRHDAVDRAHHQVHVDRCLHAVAAQCRAHHRADGEIRHVVIVHHVEVNEVGAGLEHRIDLRAEAREVGRQDRRGYPGGQHSGKSTPRRSGCAARVCTRSTGQPGE